MTSEEDKTFENETSGPGPMVQISLKEYDINPDNLVQGCMTVTKVCININKEIDRKPKEF